MEFSQEEFDEILNIFNEESEEIVQRLNNNILTLEKNPDNKDIIIELFRDAHSLKGAARMIGFNDIQAVAHKIEDILGLAKENKLLINSEVTDVIYKAIDFINMNIELSVKAKKEVKLNDYGKFISALDLIIKSPITKEKSEVHIKNEIKIPKDSKSEESYELVQQLHQEINTINAKITEIFYLFNKSPEQADLNFILALIYDLEKLNSFFKKTSNYDLKQSLGDLLFKLDFVSKNTGILNKTEIEELKSKFSVATAMMVEILTDAGLDVLDYQSIANEKNEPKVDVAQEIPQASYPTFVTNDIINKILQLETSTDVADSILEELSVYIEKYQNTRIQIIFQKVSSILAVIKSQNLRPDAEVLNILVQGIHLSGKLINDSQPAEQEDIDLLLQSLDITEQMVTLKKEENQIELSTSKYVAPKDKSQSVISKIGNQDVFQIFESTAIKTLRVDTHKLDKLVNQIGEVIISKIKTQKHILELEEINNRLIDLYEFASKSQNYLKYYDRKIAQYDKESDINLFMNFNKQFLSYWNENQARLNNEIKAIYGLHKHMQEDDAKLTLVVNKLEQMVKDIRLLPLATVFHMIPRMVRDIGKEKGKDIELSISGSETNADKKIIEEIKTPLIHIIRNAIDHGIETPNERIAQGKEATGRIYLSARHSENKVIIEINDDGRGVNLEKIRQKAITKGLLTFEELNSMTDEQIMNLIFWPGFSTEDAVTDISGRGIGLDIVQTKITQLNGKVKVNSVIGQGTKVIIELPVTMATIKSFIIKLNNQNFAVPVSAIKGVLKVSTEDIYTKDGKDNILYHQTSVPIFNLSKVLGFKPNPITKDKKTILLIEAENNIVGFVVEELIGDQEILNKELAPPLFKLKNISGVTTLINGEICLIINVSEILKTIMTHDYKQFAPIKQFDEYNGLTINPTECNILVIDDFMTTRIMLKNILTAKGFNVDIANDGLEGLDRIAQNHYDVVVSDVEMPNLNGFELTEKIKGYDITSRIPVILITSLSSDDVKNRAKQAGADLFICKNDFNQDYFLSAIEYLIKKRKKNSDE
ncbi:hybrid sensor histidine kinase/response regulator [bacterium]|nr:hybrid sensor histidine kinase/response regulator [bacterium]